MAWVADGRTALEAALRHCAGGGPWLVPAYCCPAVRQTFLAAGIQTEYYPVDESLVPVWDCLKARLEQGAAAGIVIIHYFGFRTDWTPLKSLLVSRKIPLIEDCAHLPMPDPGCENLESEARIYSPRKWLPIPHGGMLMLKHFDGSPQSLFQKSTPDLVPQLARSAAFALERGLRLNLRGWLLSLPAFERRVESQDAVGHAYGLAMDPRLVAFIKNGAPAAAEIAQKQRNNYEALAHHLISLPSLRLWRRPMPEDCPYTLPVLLDPARRDGLLRYCLRRGVMARAYWRSLPPEVMASADFETSRRLSESLLCLPIHYRLSSSDLDRVRAVVAAFFNE